MKTIWRFGSLLSLCLLAVTGFLAIGAAGARKQTQSSTPSSAGQQTATQTTGQSSGLGGVGPQVHGTADDPLRDHREVHLRHVKQLTFGGQNAEAYFSADGKRLIFQSTRPPYSATRCSR